MIKKQKYLKQMSVEIKYEIIKQNEKRHKRENDINLESTKLKKERENE